MPARPDSAAPPRPGFWRRRLLDPLRAQLRQGVAPGPLALTVALGLVVGIVPVLGVTTVACGLLAVWLRLNQPVIQLVNYLVYPLQIALLLPFLRAGEWLFGTAPLPLLSVADLTARFQADAGQFFLDYGRLGLCALAVWALLAPGLIALIYALTKPLLRRLSRT